MQDTQLTVGSVISAGWQKAKEKLGLLIGAILIIYGIQLGFSIFNNIFSVIGQNSNSTTAFTLSLLSLAVSLGSLAVSVLLNIGLLRIQLNVLDAKDATIGMLFKAEGLFWRFLGASLLLGLLVVAGLILFIIPGIYWAIKYQFILPLIVDKKQGIGEAFTTSGKITMGYKGWLLGLAIVLGLINIAGFLALGVGLLITIPLTFMTQIYVYRQLAGKAGVAKETTIEKVTAKA